MKNDYLVRLTCNVEGVVSEELDVSSVSDVKFSTTKNCAKFQNDLSKRTNCSENNCVSPMFHTISVRFDSL